MRLSPTDVLYLSTWSFLLTWTFLNVYRESEIAAIYLTAFLIFVTYVLIR